MKLNVRDFRTRAGLKSSSATMAYRRFAKSDDGVMSIFACFIVLMMILIGGIGVDLMRHEMERTRIQAVADRAVLAAADLDNNTDAELVVRDYFDKSGMADYVISVSAPPSANGKTVRVEANKTIQTMFMGNMGVETLEIPAASTAEERVPNVEISLVLDISGSMRNSSRMDNLRPAAVKFVNTVLKEDAVAKTSIQLIPYAGHTNPGPWMFNRLNGIRYPVEAMDEDDGGIDEADSNGILPDDDDGGEGSDEDVRYVYPNVSSCLDIPESDFDNTSLPSQYADQTAHFMNWRIASSVMDWGWCPQDQTAIKYMSNDKDALNGLINSMRMHDGTGTHYAMKYAVALLDPAARDDMTAMANENEISSDFVGRPADYSDETTVKYIVLMTDGQITQQVRPKQTMHSKNPVQELNEGRRSDRTTITSSGTNVQSFFEQCDLAKNKRPRGIVIYTIAFDAPGNPEDQMRECASSPSHFFKADGGSIADVFEAIARQINQLRLTR